MSSTIQRFLNKQLPYCLACCLAGGATAQQPSPPPPLEVQAEQGELDMRKRIAVYTGKVIVTQGEIRLSGDRLQIYYDASQRPQKLLLEGAPAHYRGRVRKTGEEHAGMADEAEAQHVEYRVGEDLLLLEGKARIKQPEFILESARIEYDIRLGKVRMSQGQWSLPGPPEDLWQ